MEGISLQYIAVGLMAVGMLGSALGIGAIFTALLNGIARNPSAEDKMVKHAYVGAGLAESIAIFSLVIALILILG